MTTPALEITDVRKRYGAVLALDGVTLGVPRGELFGLLGPNGAGKTTLLSIVGGLLSADSGQVRVLDHPVSVRDRDFRAKIGVVPQDLAVYEELTARENVTFFARLYGLRAPEVAKRTARVLQSVGLADAGHARVSTFSGGMKRRLNLAIGMVHGPAVLLLDEPTAGVDPQSRHHIFEEVRRLNAEGTTIVYTSHYMEEVQALCPRIAIIDRGRLIACDSRQHLLGRLSGLIRLTLPAPSPEFQHRVEQLPGVRLQPAAAPGLALETRDTKGTLLRLIALLNELQLGLTSLETEEPNLERVFLHLTGRDLRD